MIKLFIYLFLFLSPSLVWSMCQKINNEFTCEKLYKIEYKNLVIRNELLYKKYSDRLHCYHLDTEILD